MRVALAVIAALGAILLFLLASASANTALFAENYPWLLAINGIAAAKAAGMRCVAVASTFRPADLTRADLVRPSISAVTVGDLEG